MNNILAYIALFGYLGDNHFSISGKDNNIVYIATIGYIFVFPKRSTYESLFPIDIELKVTYHYLGSLNGIERSYFRFALLAFAVFLLQISKIINGESNQIGQVVFYLFYTCFYLQKSLFSLIGIIASDTDHRNLGEAIYILIGDRAQELFRKRLKALI